MQGLFLLPQFDFFFRSLSNPPPLLRSSGLRFPPLPGRIVLYVCTGGLAGDKETID